MGIREILVDIRTSDVMAQAGGADGPGPTPARRYSTPIRPVQIWMYGVPNRNEEILRIVTCITRRYVPVQSRTSGSVL
jgi:hypothetical protein